MSMSFSFQTWIFVFIFKVFNSSLIILSSDNMFCMYLILEQLLSSVSQIKVNLYKQLYLYVLTKDECCIVIRCNVLYVP